MLRHGFQEICISFLKAMIAKLNELRQAIDSKESQLVELKKKLASLQGEKQALERELNLAEKLASEAASSGFIKVKFKYFTFPWNYYGGANFYDRKYGREEIRYLDPEQAFLLLVKQEEGNSGSGIEYTKV